MSEDIDAQVAASLERLGAKGGSAAPQESKPVEVDYEKLAGMVAAKLKPAETPAPQAASDAELTDALRKLASGEPKRYVDPGAPSGPPPDYYDRDPLGWSRDYIERLQKDGTFLEEVKKYRDRLPGGGNGLFRRKIPK